jgi:elongation factor 3
MEDAHKKTPVGPRIEALEKLCVMAKAGTFKEIEAVVVSELLPVVLARLDDKPKVKAAALAAATAIVDNLAVQGFLFALPTFFGQLTAHSKWNSKVGTMELLQSYILRVFKADRDLLSACLPELVPVLGALLHDTMAEVTECAEKTLKAAMDGTTNRDLEPFVDDLIAAIKDRDETEETIQKLGGVVFVQTVEGSALSVVVPLMLAGLATDQPKAMIKRMCARIVSNMSKLVEDPLEAAPFLGDLIPALYGAIDTIADPEAREVATKTHTALVAMAEAGAVLAKDKAFRDPNVIVKFAADSFKPTAAQVCARFSISV